MPPRLELVARSIRWTERKKASGLGWLAYVFAILPGALGHAWMTMGGDVPGRYWRWVGALTVLGLVSLTLALMYIMRSGDPGKAIVKDGRLILEPRGVAIRFDELVSGIALERDSGSGLVELVTDTGAVIEIELHTVDAARTLLTATGVERDARVTIVRVGTRYPASLVVTTATGIAVFLALNVAHRVAALFGPIAGSLLVLFGVISTGLLGAWIFSGTDVVVGRDGIALRHLFSRFIPYDDVREVDTGMGDERLRLTLDDGHGVTLQPLGADDPQRMAALGGYIRRAMTVDEGSGVAAINVLNRHRETVAEWRARLKHLLALEPGYRGAKIQVSDAVAIIADAGRAPVHRLGAALALAEADALDGDARRQLRIAAEGSANPKLRVAFEALADGDVEDAAIEEALAMAASRRNKQQ